MSFTSSIASAGEYVLQTVKHPTKRNIIYFLVIVWINAINFYLFHHRLQVLSHFTSSMNDVAPVNNYKGHAIPRKLIDNIVFKMWEKNGNIVKDSRRIDTHLGNYDDFFSVHEVSSIVGLSFTERCDAYFRSLYAKSKAWHVNTDNAYEIDMDYQMDWEAYKKKYTDWAVEQIAKDKKIKELEVDKGSNEVHDVIAKACDTLKDKAKKDEYAMRDLIAHMRIFNRCYVEREDAPFRNAQEKFIQKQHAELKSMASKFVATDNELHLSKDAFHLCSDLQAKVYPWIHDSFPIYQRYTGDILRSPPRMAKYVSEHEVNSATDHTYSSGKGIKKPVLSTLTGNKQCWVNEFKNKISGKGIVIPFTLTTLEDTLNLIHLLRALGNKYPVQIVYYSDMSKEQKEKIVDAARRPFTDMPQSFSKVSDLIDKLALDHKTNGFLPLELWLVDASSMVSQHFQKRLSTVPIIAWASVVNSFEEFILMDPLASPLQNPKYFFDLPEYRETGAYFYRDRAWEKRDIHDAKFFNKMSPSMVDETAFGIPIVPSEVLDIPFFSHLSQVQDSRLAVINRARHFSSVMMQLQLAQFFPANYRANNGLEIWLGFVLNGDYDFHFHDVMPGALGKLTDTALRLKGGSRKPDSKEICSTQVGHIDLSGDSPKLAWISGGFQGCSSRKIDFPTEKSSKVFPWIHIFEEEDLRSYYNNRITLENAIIPPFKDMNSLKVDNEEQEPNKPWVKHEGCEATFFCGFSKVGGKKGEKDNTVHGKVIEFDRTAIELFNFYGDIWIGSD